MVKQIAITGATGFIGRKLAMYHFGKGDKVRILSRCPPDGAGLSDSFEWFLGDLSESDNLRDFVDGVDVLYHCAGEIIDESRMEAVHVVGTHRLIEAAKGRIGRWVQLSSTGAYGRRREGVVTEQTELNPHGMYEVTKVASDALVQAASSSGAFEQAILRPSIVYGAGMPNQSIYGLTEMIRRGWFFFIGKPGASANYIHVDNVIEALVLCGNMPQATGQIYNLSDHCTLERFVAIICQVIKCTVPRNRLPKLPVKVLAKLLSFVPRMPLTQARIDALTTRVIYSSEKIERELGYKHRISIETGLRELISGKKK